MVRGTAGSPPPNRYGRQLKIFFPLPSLLSSYSRSTPSPLAVPPGLLSPLLPAFFPLPPLLLGVHEAVDTSSMRRTLSLSLLCAAAALSLRPTVLRPSVMPPPLPSAIAGCVHRSSQRVASPLMMAAADEQSEGDARDGGASASLTRPAMIGAAVAAVLGISSRIPGLLAVVLQMLSVGLPAWSVTRLWRNGKQRAAITLACSAAARRFCTRWWQYCTIPIFAGAVGWLTNKVEEPPETSAPMSFLFLTSFPHLLSHADCCGHDLLPGRIRRLEAAHLPQPTSWLGRLARHRSRQGCRDGSAHYRPSDDQASRRR
mgnify:CR=1 FL=1